MEEGMGLNTNGYMVAFTGDENVLEETEDIAQWSRVCLTCPRTVPQHLKKKCSTIRIMPNFQKVIQLFTEY
jgi:hypothetical protein